MWLGSLASPSPTGHLPTRATLQGIPEGIPGAIATLKVMRQLAREAIRDPAQRIRETALSIVGGAGYVGQVRAIQQWIQDNIRYILDPTDDTGGVELVQTPQKTLDYQAGDCDDQSVLAASLLSALGHPSRFIAIGFQGQDLSHVLTQTKIGSSGNDAQDWVSLETIRPEALGWFPSGVTSHYILKV